MLSEGRILIVGDTCSGKSRLCSLLYLQGNRIRNPSVRNNGDGFADKLNPSNHVKYCPTYIVNVVDYGFLGGDCTDIHVPLWDLAGGDEFLDIRRVLYTQGPPISGVIVTVTKGPYLDMISSVYKWKREIVEKLFGSKSADNSKDSLEFIAVVFDKPVPVAIADPSDELEVKIDSPLPVRMGAGIPDKVPEELDGTQCIDLTMTQRSEKETARLSKEFSELTQWVEDVTADLSEKLSIAAWQHGSRGLPMVMQ